MRCSSIICVVLASASLQAAETLLVLSKGNLTVALVDAATLAVGKRLPTGPDPHEVIASSDGHLAFISNYGGGRYNTLAVIDLMKQEALPSIDLGALRGPHGLEFAGGKVWFTAEAAKAIGSYDPATRQIDWIQGTGQDRTHMLTVTSDAQHIVTSNIASDSLSFIDRAQQGWSQQVVKVGGGPEGFDVSPDGREIWAANSRDGTISVVEVATHRVAATIQANVPSANRLKFSPDGKLVIVSMLRAPEVAIFDTATRTEKKRLAVGHGAAGILMQPDGKRAFVSCTPDDYVDVIDLTTLTVTGRIDAGKQPDGLAWAVRK